MIPDAHHLYAALIPPEALPRWGNTDPSINQSGLSVDLIPEGFSRSSSISWTGSLTRTDEPSVRFSRVPGSFSVCVPRQITNTDLMICRSRDVKIYNHVLMWPGFGEVKITDCLGYRISVRFTVRERWLPALLQSELLCHVQKDVTQCNQTQL